jgi:GT2 family glycosyltransferase
VKIVNLIVTFNRANVLRQCLQQLREKGFLDVILVDNNSTDHTSSVANEMAADFKEFNYIRLPENRGCSGGINIGLKKFLTGYGETAYCLVHDDDSWPLFARDQLEIDALADTALGCFPVVHTDGSLVKMNRPGNLDALVRPFSISTYVKPRRPNTIADFKHVNSFDYSSFVGLLINGALLRKVGIPSPSFFIYSDDTYFTAYCSQICGHSIKNLHFGSLTFAHDCKRSTGKTLLASRFAFQEVRNKVILLRRFSRVWILHIIYFAVSCFLFHPKGFYTIIKGLSRGLSEDTSKYDPELVDKC